MDELDYALRYRMMQNLAEETATHRHSIKASAVPIRQYGSFNPGTGVGGAGEHWGAICYRFYSEHFRLASFLREQHGNRLADDLAVEDWGVTYDELEPYSWRAEQLIGVGGKAGNLQGKKIDGGNVFEGPRSHEYPNPPHKLPYATTLFEKAVRELGYHPYPVPTATLSRTYTNPDGVTRPALRLLRLLLTLRLHDWRQGTAYQCADAGSREAQEPPADRQIGWRDWRRKPVSLAQIAGHRVAG